MCRLSMSRLVEGFTQAFVAEFILPDSTSLVLNNLQPFHQQSFQVGAIFLFMFDFSERSK
jgi:hypothetical protein